MSDKTQRQRDAVNRSEQSGARSEASAQQRREQLDRQELAERTKTTPTNPGGGDGAKK